MSLFIHVFFKNDFIRTREIPSSKETITFGRSPENDISFSFDDLVSGKHGKILISPDSISVIDQHSKNGIYCNGKKQDKIITDFDQKIFLGNSSFVITRNAFQEIKKTISLADNPVIKTDDEKQKHQTEKMLKFLYEISKSNKDYVKKTDLLDHLFEELFKRFQVDRIIYFEKPYHSDVFKILKIKDFRMKNPRTDYSFTVLDEIASTHKAVFIKNLTEDHSNKPKTTIKHIGVNSFIAIPLFFEKHLSGILQLDIFDSARMFGDEDFYMICLISQVISSFLNDMNLIEDMGRENQLYKKQINRTLKMIGRDEKTKKLLEQIDKVSNTDTTVLITGESGTGKELVAKAIHFKSHRKKFPLIIINCAALPEHLIESEFFGHVKGAYTGAQSNRIGKFEAASRGTVFLDEIGDMPLSLQSKLLRFLELGEIQPVGSNEIFYKDVRIIAATNKNLKEAVQNKSFREDLYYRLMVFHVNCPSLRERKKDLELLSEYYLNHFSFSMGKQLKSISPKVMTLFQKYDWPGNIRELKNIIERAFVLGDGETLTLDFIPEELKNEALPSHHSRPLSDIKRIEKVLSLEELEKQYILSILQKYGDNKAKAAKILGITRKTLYAKLRQYEDDEQC